MSLISIFLIAFSLSLDAVAVALACGLSATKIKLSQSIRMPLAFGLFQGVMPVIGWLAGNGLKTIITGIDHWVAFILLAAIGLRMIYESMAKTNTTPRENVFELKSILILALATSIDALAVGLSLAFLKISIFLPAIIIGLTTFILSLFGLWTGSRFKSSLSKKAEFLGGLILIIIGLKILVQHLLG